MKFSFIHTADIHLGRAFADINYELSPSQKNILNIAHEKALETLCDFAIEKNVDFILIAGDTFDDCEHDLHSRLVLYNILKRLEINNTGVYIIPGNHDPESSYTKELGFKDSDYIKIFGVNIPYEPLAIKNKNGENVAIIYPFGFKTTEFPHSPCTVLSKAQDSTLFNIGLIHCDKTGDKNNVYAPCTEKELLELGYDYYALGHIHKPDIGKKIVYPGTLQARSRKDTGEHGFCYIEVDNNNIVSNSFVTCDRIRYYNLVYSVNEDETEMNTISNILTETGRLSSGIELIIVNLILEGVCKYKKPEKELLKREISNERVVVSNIEDNTSAEQDLDTIKSSGGVLSQMLVALETEDTLASIADITDKELADILKLTENFNRTEVQQQSVKITENICKEVYDGEDKVNE